MSSKSSSQSDPLPRRSFTADPVHLRIADLCRKAILDGDFSAGDKFPSERELASRYSVSRSTANKVVNALISEGLLELKKGIGTSVRKTETLFASLSGMKSFTAHAIEQGLEPSTQVLRFNRQLSSSLSPAVQEGLGLSNKKTAEPVVYLERLRLAGEVPMILEHRWILEQHAPELKQADVENSFYQILEEKFGLPMTGEQHSISAVLLDDKSATIFEIKPPAAALLVEGTGFIKGDTPLWYQQLFYRGDRYQLHNETRGPVSAGLELRLQKQRISA